MSGIRLPDGCKFLVNQKKGNDVRIFRHEAIVDFFWRWCVSLTKFCYWSKFHINIMTGSGVMTIFFYKGLSINQETKNTPPEFWSISGDWGELEIRENQKCVCVWEGEGVKLPHPHPPPPRLRLKTIKKWTETKTKVLVLI